MYTCRLLSLAQHDDKKECIDGDEKETPDRHQVADSAMQTGKNDQLNYKLEATPSPTESRKEYEGKLTYVIRKDGTVVDLCTNQTITLPPAMEGGDQIDEMETQQENTKSERALSVVPEDGHRFDQDTEQVHTEERGTSVGSAPDQAPNPNLLNGMVFFITDYIHSMSRQIIDKWNEVCV